MAKFFPKLELIDNETPHSERIVLRAFEKALSDDFHIYHIFSFFRSRACKSCCPPLLHALHNGDDNTIFGRLRDNKTIFLEFNYSFSATSI